MKILIYDDNSDYGGHQIMACLGIKALSDAPSTEIIVMYNPANRKLADALPAGANIQKLEAPCSTSRFQGLRNRYNQKKIVALSKSFQSIRPDLVLAIQGDIEGSSQGVLAAGLAGIECISYIAVPHTMKKMGTRLGALRDRFNQYLFSKPDRYITISNSMKTLLIQRGVNRPIAVVPNGILFPEFQREKKSESRQTIGILGRIEFKQKQHDFLVSTFCSHPDAFKDYRLLIAGNGPDENQLKALIKPNQNIELWPWQEDPDIFFKSIDLLIIPSRFEGVPLVMLEALARGIPVIGSNCDGMKDILPNAWTFKPENSESLVKTFLQVKDSWQSEMPRLQSNVQSKNSETTFMENFRDAVIPHISQV